MRTDECAAVMIAPPRTGKQVTRALVTRRKSLRHKAITGAHLQIVELQ
jgi:hypothetical protein